MNATVLQLEMPLDDPRRPSPDAIRFADFDAKHPGYFQLLVAAARRSVDLCGFAEMHHLRTEVKIKCGKGPARTFLPAYARKIAAECPDLRGKIATRPSRFGK